MTEPRSTAEVARELHESGMTGAEIARRLGITPGAVSNALRRAGVESSRPAPPRRRVMVDGQRQEPDPHALPRDPCFACGVPGDRHDEYGCKRWRPRS